MGKLGSTVLGWLKSVAVGKGSIAPFDRIGISTSEGGQAAQLSRPAQQSAWVLRAIRLIAQPIASVPLQLCIDDEGTPLEDPAVKLRFRKLAQGMTHFDFIEATVGWLKLKECFWILDESWTVPFPTAAKAGPIKVARPDQMRVIKDDHTDEIIAWEWRRGKGKAELLDPARVIHLKHWNPYDEERGVGDYPAAETAAETDFLQGQFTRALAKNNGDTGPYLTAKGAPPTQEQIEQIKLMMEEKRLLNRRGIWRPTFLPADVSIDDPKVQVPDAAFYGGRLQNRHEIATAFGIPMSMFDVQASYSIGSASDYFRLIMETCVPMAAKIADALEQLASHLAGRQVVAKFDFEQHPVVQAVKAERREQAEGLWDRGMPWKQINEYLDLGMQPFPGWEVAYVPFNVGPVGETSPAASDPEFGEPTDAPEEESPLSAMQKLFAARAEGKETAGEDFQQDRPSDEVRQWEGHMASRRPIIKSYTSAFTRELMKARAEVLAKVDQHRSKSVTTKAAAADFIFDLDVFRTGLLGAMRKVAARALKLSGEDVFKELELDDPWEVAPEEVLSFTKSRDNRLAKVADGVWGRIKSDLADGFDAGDSMDDLAKRVRKSFNDEAKGRAHTVAQTETAAAYGAGRQAAMQAAGITHKKWLTSGNANVRPSHRRANGQTVAIDGDYKVGSAELSHPGDPSGPAGEVINCHCVSIPVKAPTS